MADMGAFREAVIAWDAGGPGEPAREPAARRLSVRAVVLLEGPSGAAAVDAPHISPYLAEHIRRFGDYSTHELGDGPAAYDPHLNVDFTSLRGPAPGAEGFGTAA
ncbi:hypothetical protein GCM10027162_49800 [Streptomyces incanus]